MANVDDTVTAEWTWGGHRFSAHGVVTKVSGKTTKVRLTEDAGEHFVPGFVVTVPTENVRKKEETMARTPLHGRQAPRPIRRPYPHEAPRADNRGYHVMKWGGGTYTSVGWFSTRQEAENEVDRIKRSGAWSGMPPKIEAAAPSTRARENTGRPLPRRPLRAREGDERDQRWVSLDDGEARDLMTGWTGGERDPLYAISSSGGNYAWVFTDAIANLDADLRRVRKLGRNKFQLGNGTFSGAEIDELQYIRDALAEALRDAS